MASKSVIALSSREDLVTLTVYIYRVDTSATNDSQAFPSLGERRDTPSCPRARRWYSGMTAAVFISLRAGTQ